MERTGFDERGSVLQNGEENVGLVRRKEGKKGKEGAHHDIVSFGSVQYVQCR